MFSGQRDAIHLGKKSFCNQVKVPVFSSTAQLSQRFVLRSSKIKLGLTCFRSSKIKLGLTCFRSSRLTRYHFTSAMEISL